MRRIPWASISRLLLPAILLAVAITASLLSTRANQNSDPGMAVAVSGDPAAGSPVLSARRAPEWLRSPLSGQLLGDAISNLVSQAPQASCLVLHRGEEVLAEHNIDASIRPGDLQRLITVAALDDLGSTGYRTEVAIDSNAEISDGVLNGDVWIIGGGDPVLSTRAFNDRFGDSRAFSDLDALFADAVAELQRLGVNDIAGRVYGDESKYSVERSYVGIDYVDPDGERGDIWTSSDAAAAGIGPLSGLLYNNGVESWSEDGDVLTSDPARSLAGMLDDAFEAAGFRVRQSPRSGTAPELADRREIAVLDSPPLNDIMARALIDPTTAEMLLKEIGIRQGGSSDRESALVGLMNGGFADAGLPYVLNGPVRYLDGSGLSDFNRSTCAMLFAAIDDPDGAARAVLPPADQSLVAECLPNRGGELRILATVDEITTGMAGHYTAVNGDVLSFALMAQDPGRTETQEGAEAPVGPYEACNPLQTALLSTVTGYPYGPDIETLSPLAPGS